MKNIITDGFYDEEIAIICDCDCELVNFFLEVPLMKKEEPVIGFSYFNSYNRSKLKDYYFEFASLEDFNLFRASLTPSEDVRFICLRNYYSLYTVWGEDSLIIHIHKFNKKFKESKKPIITLSFNSDKVKELKEELDSWEVHF